MSQNHKDQDVTLEQQLTRLDTSVPALSQWELQTLYQRTALAAGLTPLAPAKQTSAPVVLHMARRRRLLGLVACLAIFVLGGLALRGILAGGMKSASTTADMAENAVTEDTNEISASDANDEATTFDVETNSAPLFSEDEVMAGTTLAKLTPENVLAEGGVDCGIAQLDGTTVQVYFSAQENGACTVYLFDEQDGNLSEDTLQSILLTPAGDAAIKPDSIETGSGWYQIHFVNVQAPNTLQIGDDTFLLK